MKSFTEIYDSLKSKFFNRSKLEIQPGTVMDCFMLSATEALHEAHQEIENNKNPYIFTKLSGEDLDSTGYLVNCPRMPNEDDSTYFHRIINWTYNNATSNIIAIENALLNLTYASYAKYVPLTEGVGTATVYIIPKAYDATTKINAITEVKQRLTGVVSKTSYVSYAIPTQIPIKIVASLVSENGDITAIKSNIQTKIQKYINSIAIGDYLTVGQLNKIGIEEANVDYFNVLQLYVNGQVTTSLKILQRIDTKMMFDQIIW